MMPWVLTQVELLSNDAVPHASGPVLRCSPSSNGAGSPRLIYAIPAGFITGTFMELDIFNDAELAKFCGRWGMVAAPYAGSVSRLTARLVSEGTEEALLEKAYEADGCELPRHERIDCERYGRGIWYAGLEGAPRDLAFRTRLGGSNWMESFNRDDTARGGEVLNAYHFASSGRDKCSLVYVDEVRRALAIMRIAILISGFYEIAEHKALKALKMAVKYDSISEERFARRPFEEALSLFMDTGFLHLDKSAYASQGVFNGVRTAMASRNFKIIEENAMMFSDLCLSSIPEPLVAHEGFRRGELASLKMPDAGGNAAYGNLLQAMAAQLYAYLCDGNPWSLCEVCGRPFKYEQQNMSPITSESEAQEVYKRRHKPTRTVFCSKRHEKRIYGRRNAENAKLRKALSKIRAEKSRGGQGE